MRGSKIPDDIESPDFEIDTPDDAKEVLKVIQEFDSYILILEIRQIRATTTRNMLHAALDWVKYAIGEYKAAGRKLGSLMDALSVIREALDLLQSMLEELRKMVSASNESEDDK
ncbi:hypothetical protein F4805DRAFT_459712 [Annulohypoxylon moriforme]|nr:hypothetical protein F4805DRAFT_459712 [Annulohypoxylon moriforme]